MEIDADSRNTANSQHLTKFNTAANTTATDKTSEKGGCGGLLFVVLCRFLVYLVLCWTWCNFRRLALLGVCFCHRELCISPAARSYWGGKLSMAAIIFLKHDSRGRPSWKHMFAYISCTSDEINSKIIRLHSTGRPILDIASEVGVSGGTVSNVLKTA